MNTFSPISYYYNIFSWCVQFGAALNMKIGYVISIRFSNTVELRREEKKTIKWISALRSSVQIVDGRFFNDLSNAILFRACQTVIDSKAQLISSIVCEQWSLFVSC